LSFLNLHLFLHPIHPLSLFDYQHKPIL
jgi:hypothetical protein